MKNSNNNKFFYLVNHEFTRISKFFIPALVVFIIVQAIYCLNLITGINNRIKEIANTEMRTLEDVLKSRKGTYGMSVVIEENIVLITGVAILFVALAVYCVITWYIEWFGNNKTIYQLLVLPYDRFNIFLAKATTIFICFCSVVTTFILNVIINYFLLKMFLLKGLLQDNALIIQLQSGTRVYSIAPSHPIDLIIYILSLVGIIFVLFDIPLLERSYKWIGLLLGLAMTVLYSYVYIILETSNWLFLSESVVLMISWSSLFIILSSLLAKFLLKKKISV